MERESEAALEKRQSGNSERFVLTIGKGAKTPDPSKRFWCNAGDANPLAETVYSELIRQFRIHCFSLNGYFVIFFSMYHLWY